MTLRELKDYLNTYGEEYDDFEVVIDDSEWGLCKISESEMGLIETGGATDLFVIGTV